MNSLSHPFQTFVVSWSCIRFHLSNMSILNFHFRHTHTPHTAMVPSGVFGGIAEVSFIQAPVTTSWGAVLPTEAENVQTL